MEKNEFRPSAELAVSEKAAKSIRAGHPWVYGEEVRGVSGTYRNGDIVSVVNAKGKWLGAGFVNDASKIRVRLISRNKNDRFDESFFRRRIAYALDYRRSVMGEDFNACRLIFGEADHFPGLTVDRFEDVLVTEVLSLGLEMRKEMIYRLLSEELLARGVKIRALYERSDAPVREKEGLVPQTGYFALPGLQTAAEAGPEVSGTEPAAPGHVMITENGIRYDVDYINGQKTGFFLDQKYNRRLVGRLAAGRTVLDCCTHTGAFALNAAAGGADRVTALDVSADALAQAAKNAALNGLSDKVSFVRADIFDYLDQLAAGPRGQFDFIILDPPAFTKSRETAQAAFRGYKDINKRAMQALPRGGILVTCSCSHFMTDEMFREMLREAARDVNVELRQIEARQQAPDHPILWGVLETEYLKFYALQVV